jgi:hypothetical protein
MGRSLSYSRRATRPRVGIAAGLTVTLLVVVTLAACGGDDDTAGAITTSPIAATSTTAAPATSTTTAPQTSTTTAVVGEDVFGWLRSFEGRDHTTLIRVDPAEMLTGDEAEAAARQDGVIGEDEDLPNDFYIRNPDETTTEFTVSPDVVVTLQACYEDGKCVTTEQVDVETWSALLGGEEDPGLEWSWYGAGSLPCVFTVVNGVIVEVQEVYLP